jgi:hypothetical protein
LEAITDLTTGDGARGVVTSVSRNEDARSRNRIEAATLTTPATVDADVNAAPIIRGRNHHRRLAIGLRRKIGSKRGRGDTHRHHTNDTSKNLFIPFSPASCALRMTSKRFAPPAIALRSGFRINHNGSGEQKPSPK